MTQEFSLLRTAKVRELPIALAHALAVAKLGDQPRQALLGRIFASLRWVDKIRCRAELRECLAARRGERLAVVS